MASRRPSRLARLFRWTVWLALTGALAIQLRILHDGGLRLPEFAKNTIIRRLAKEGVAFDADAIWVAPNGRVMIVRPRLGLVGQDSPFATARAVGVQLRRRELLAGKVRATELELAGLTLSIPAIASPTGAVQPILEAGEFRLSSPPGADTWSVDQASARLLSIPASFSGTLPATRGVKQPRRAPVELARETLRQTAAVYREIARLPLDTLRVVRVDLSPEQLALSTELPAFNSKDYPLIPAEFPEFSLDTVQATLVHPLDTSTSDLGELRLHARQLHFAGPVPLEGQDVGLRISARSSNRRIGNLSDQQIALSIAAARFHAPTLPLAPVVPLVAEARFFASDRTLHLDLSTRLADAPWSARLAGSLADQTGFVSASGELTPGLLEFIRPHLPEKARPILELTDPVRIDTSVEIAPGAKPARIIARASSGRAVAGHVPFDRAGAVLLYEPAERRFRADELVLVQSDSLAAGSYEMDTESLEFRFILGGRLRPMAIGGWFSDWWDRFWDDFHFGPVPASADVDIQGVWGEPDDTTVFVRASSGPMRLRNLDLDTLQTRLRVFAGGSVDLMAFHATKAGSAASGNVVRLIHPDTNALTRMSFDVRSDFPIEALPRLFPEEGPELVEPFALSSAPTIHLVGEIFGAASSTPGRQRYDLMIGADAPLRYSGFPLDHLSLRVERRDDEIRLRDIRAGFAAGLATGEATISGPEKDRWLAFDIHLADAELDLVQTRWREFQSTRPDTEAAQPAPNGSKDSKDAKEKAKDTKPLGGRISGHLAATGPMEDPLAYSGRGEAHIAGADLAKIRLIGPISSLLGEIGVGFTTLKLTEADTELLIDRNRLIFENLRLTGPSALVESKGVYTLPEGLLDFKAKVRPFNQGEGILSSTFNLFTSPLSNVLEVELSGPLDDPTWTFTYGPTKLLRKIF